MKRSWGIIACILLLTGCHTSKRPVLYELQDHGDVKLNELQEKYPFQESAYQFYRHEIVHDLKPDVTNNAPRWYYFESYHWKEVVLDKDNVSSDNQIVFEIANDEKVRSFKARITKLGEEPKVFHKKHLKRVKGKNKPDVYSLDVEDMLEGSTIEVAYEVERDNLMKAPPMSHDVPLQLDKPVEYFEFGYTYPRHWDVQVKQLGGGNKLTVVESEDDKTETRKIAYSSASIPEFQKEMYGPDFKQVAPYFHVKVNYLEVGNVVERRGSDDWKQVAASYGDVMISSRKIKQRSRNKLQDLGIEMSMSEAEKLKVIQNHIDNDIFVLGREDSGDIWKKGTGNPFEVTQYAAHLFEAAEITTDFLVAHTSSNGYFDEDFVTSEQIYSPLLRVHIAGQLVYLFPAIKGVPTGYIPSTYTNQVAFLYAEDGYKGFASIPEPSSLAFKDTGHYDLFVNGDGEVRTEATLRIGQHNTFEFNQRMLQEHVDEAELVKQLLAHHSTNINMLSYTISRNTLAGEIELKASYDLDECFEPDMESHLVQSCGLFEPVNKEWYPFTTARNTPYIIPADLSVTNDIRVIYPEAWTVATDLRNVARNGERVIFERTHATNQGEININQHLIVKEQALSSSRQSFLANSIQLPLGTMLSDIELSIIPTVDLAQMQRSFDIDPEGPWTLVVSSMKSYEDAVDKVQELESREGIEALPIRIFGEGPIQDRYHILLGMFYSRKEVETTRIMLADQIPFDTWIAVLNPQMVAVLSNTAPVTY